MQKLSLLIKISVFILFFSNNLHGANLPWPFMILPQPQSITTLKDGGPAFGTLASFKLAGSCKLPVLGPILSQLILTSNTKEQVGVITLILDKNVSGIPSDEGYIMTVRKSSVEIIARAEAGLFYGCQSLEQLMEDARQFNKRIPACRIQDYPILGYRAVHFDLKHHLDHLNYYYQSIDRLARYKINAVVFEFEDKLRFERQPLIGAPGAISIDEMAALTEYARKRFIEITPLVQGLGHASFILKHEAYAGQRELSWNSWAFCPLNESTYEVLFDLYRDAIKATPGSKYLHIGGDEIGNIGLCPRCKPVADKNGTISLNLYWLKRVCAFARDNKRIPVFWDDMPLQYAGLYKSTWSDAVNAEQAKEAWEKGTPVLDSLLADFPTNCIYMRWNYSMATQPGNVKALEWYKSRGLKAMIATATNAEGGMLFQEDNRDTLSAAAGIVTIRNFIRLAEAKNIPGMLCTAWDDKSPHMENYWRGFIAAAEYSWSSNGRSLEAFDSAWLQREFGTNIPDYLAFNQDLRKGSTLWYEAYFKQGSLLDEENQLMSLKRVEHWLPPLPDQENRQFDYGAKLIELPDVTNQGKWTNKYRDRLNKSVIELDNYPRLIRKLRGTLSASRRNQYYWSLSIALYNFQMTAPRLLAALEQCDSPSKEQQQNGMVRLQVELTNADKYWLELQSVYSKTRFTAYPSTYVPDRYFHLASQREDLTWMTQAQDMFIQKIKIWLQKK